MKKLLIVSVLMSTVALAGCASTIGTSTGTTTPPPISTGDATLDAEIQAAQAAAVKACGFLPTVSTITGILSTFVPATTGPVAIGTSIAQAICNAITPKATAKRKLGPVSAPQVNGVPVEGIYVR